MQDAFCDVAIIGAGIVGLSVGLQFSRENPALRVIIVEKESEVASHQTGHNSGVIHSGLYYKPGSLKARLCVTGAEAMKRFCADHGVPFEICGKVVVATGEDEMPALEELLRRGHANGVAGLRRLNAEQIRELEPHAAGICGIHVPGTGITDFKAVARKYAELIESRGGGIVTGFEVSSIHTSSQEIVLESSTGVIRAKYLINCAGLHSDRIARLTGARLDLQIVPFRGEYYEIVPQKHYLVKGLIYPVPDPRFPFLGVHFTRRVLGGVEAGPNAVLAFKREGYSGTSFSATDMASLATFSGFWKMASRHWKMGMGEYYRSWNKHAFTVALQKLLPELTEADIRPGGSGVRAQALGKSGALLDDFQFVYQERVLHVCNVPSPAATASLVIANEIVSTVSKIDRFPVSAVQN